MVRHPQASSVMSIEGRSENGRVSRSARLFKLMHPYVPAVRLGCDDGRGEGFRRAYDPVRAELKDVRLRIP
jgi:hypothetical protein